MKADSQKKFLEIFKKKAGNISSTCDAMGIVRQTYHNWYNTDENFRRDADNVKEGLLDFAESKLFELMNEKNPTALIFYLKTQGKKRGYVERAEFEHDVSEGVQVIIKNTWKGDE